MIRKNFPLITFAKLIIRGKPLACSWENVNNTSFTQRYSNASIPIGYEFFELKFLNFEMQAWLFNLGPPAYAKRKKKISCAIRSADLVSHTCVARKQSHRRWHMKVGRRRRKKWNIWSAVVGSAKPWKSLSVSLIDSRNIGKWRSPTWNTENCIFLLVLFLLYRHLHLNYVIYMSMEIRKVLHTSTRE